jgi:hypothetical protein
MSRIAELEAQLALEKKKEQLYKWEEYLNKSEKYLKSIVGKCYMRPYQNGRFTMFKVKGYKPHYYVTTNGFNGDWHPSRWFELEVTKSINCSVEDSTGKYFRPEVKYINFSFIAIKGRKKDNLVLSKIDVVNYEEEKYTRLDSEIREFGKLSYESGVPDFDSSLLNFQMGLKECSEEMLNAAIEIAEDNVRKTKEFWETWQPIIKKS